MQKLLSAIVLSLISVVFTTVAVSSINKDKTLFIHSVYFWLNDDVTSEQRLEFIEIIEGLEEIKSVKSLKIGVPAGTPRAVVDNTYDIALLVYFEDKEGHDSYQSDPIHTAAVAGFEDWIYDVKIYDALCEQ